MDLNNDGRTEILSGSWPGEITLFERSGENGFTSTILEDTSGNELSCGKATATWAADWDNDGDTDLIVGNFGGEVKFVRNAGTKSKAKFEAPVALSSTESEIKLQGGDAGPCVADWDRDGKQDLLVGSGAGDVFWYKNVGTKKEPILTKPVPLLGLQGKRYVPEATEIGTRTKPCVTDWNEDGKPDLLVGDFSTGSENGGTHGFVWLMMREDMAPARAIEKAQVSP